MTEEVPQNVQFENGHPNFTYDHVYRCFKGNHNGLLFRLVNDSTKKWAFYNDTNDTVMCVKAHFSADSKVKATGRAKATMVPAEVGSQLQEMVVTVEVQPKGTEVFIDGVPNGFVLSFQTEQVSVRNVKFMNQRSTLPHYDKIYKCFKNEGNGLLFRLVDETAGKWYFYNDTKQFMMTVTVSFPLTEDIVPLGNTQKVEAKDDPDEVAYQITVAPGNCEEFIEGHPATFSQAFDARTIDESCLDPKDVHFKFSKPNSQIVDLSSSKIYKGFKDRENGLLFRIVDYQNQRWAFYNDTNVYVMKPTVRLFDSPKVSLAPGAKVVERNDDGSYAVTIDVPPLATVLLFDGLPTKYEVSLVAESVNKTAPEENPKFENGEPDKHIVNYDKVYRCLRDNPDVRLFRLVDTMRRRWGFFNDTKDTCYTATCKFDADGTITPLGSTKQQGDEFSVRVPPQSTVAFVQGNIKGFELSFSRSRPAAAAAATANAAATATATATATTAH